VASGANSAILAGRNNRATAQDAVCLGGALNLASGQGSVCFGDNNTSSGYAAFSQGTLQTTSGGHAAAFGYQCSAWGNRSFAQGIYAAALAELSVAFGNTPRSDRYSQFSHAAGAFAAGGDAQFTRFVARNKTTNTTPTTLFLNGSSVRLTIPSGKVLSAVCRICGIKSDGSAVANYVRRIVIKNVAGTTSIVGAIETIGTDIEDNASTDVAITADDTNDALDISVTGITGETWRWVAVVEGLEIAYGT
jgi:hypothetical protein